MRDLEQWMKEEKLGKVLVTDLLVSKFAGRGIFI